MFFVRRSIFFFSPDRRPLRTAVISSSICKYIPVYGKIPLRTRGDARLMVLWHLIIYLYARRFAPRAAYAVLYACSGRKNSVKRKKKSPCLIVISANWRFENAKSPAAMLQENNPQTPHASVYCVCTWYLVVFAMYFEVYISVSKLVTTGMQSFSRQDDESADTDWVCWTIFKQQCLLDVDGYIKHSSNYRVV